jgi:hypothetical protein
MATLPGVLNEFPDRTALAHWIGVHQQVQLRLFDVAGNGDEETR